MKYLKTLALAACLATAFLLTGCGSPQYAEDPVNPPKPFAFPGQQGYPTTPGTPIPGTQGAVPMAPVNVNPDYMPQSGAGILRVGDLVRVSLLDIPQPPPPIEIRIPEDGRITLPWNITVDARGKTVSVLQDEIRRAYVPKLFVHLTVNIKTEERFFFVGGEVRGSGRQPYLGDMTVLRAIDTAGGFTDFAQRKKIELRRANGQVHVINWDKARKSPKLDLQVYPNDQVMVPRRAF